MSPLTSTACTFWRLQFTAVQGAGDDEKRTLIATVFSQPYVEFSDGTGSYWLRAEDVDWRVSTMSVRDVDDLTSIEGFESLLGKGFVQRWMEVSGHREAKHATRWTVVETRVTSDALLLVSGSIQTRRSDEMGFDGPPEEMTQASSVDVELANEPIFHLHQSLSDTTPQALERAWRGVLHQIEGLEPTQPLSGSSELRTLTRGDDSNNVLEAYSGGKSRELQMIKRQLYVLVTIMVMLIVVLAIYGPQQLPFALQELKAFLAAQ